MKKIELKLTQAVSYKMERYVELECNSSSSGVFKYTLTYSNSNLLYVVRTVHRYFLYATDALPELFFLKWCFPPHFKLPLLKIDTL